MTGVGDLVLGPHDTTPDPRDEREFRVALVRMLRWHGWRVTFNPPRPARKGKHITFGSPGYPDLTALRPPWLVFLECKMVGEGPSDEQRVWLNGLSEVGGNVRAWVVNVGDWPMLVRLAHDGIEGVERSSEPEAEECA